MKQVQILLSRERVFALYIKLVRNRIIKTLSQKWSVFPSCCVVIFQRHAVHNYECQRYQVLILLQYVLFKPYEVKFNTID